LMTIFATLFNKLFKYRLVCDDHTIPNFARIGKVKKVYYSLFRQVIFPMFLLRNVDCFIAVTPAVQEWLHKKLAITNNRISFIPLGADIKLFKKSKAKRMQIRKLLNISESDILLIYAGKIIPEKNIDILVHAIAPLIVEREDVKLLLLGSGDEKYISGIVSLVKRYNLNTNVIFHSFVKNQRLPAYYSAADVGAWLGSPSITIIEAMSTGLPVILLKSRQTQHLIDAGGGCSFTYGNLEELRSCLEKLIRDDSLRKNMGVAARKNVEKNFSWERIAEKTLGIYEKVGG